MKSTVILDISLEEIQSFFAVARLKSFTEAANVLYTTQPQLSKKISAFESKIGTRLFDRSKRQVQLTPAGEQLYAELEPQIQKLEDSFERVRKMYEDHKRMIRICCDERLHVIEELLFPTILRFCNSNQKIRVELEAYDLPMLKNKLLQKETDIIVSEFPGEPILTKGIDWLKIGQAQFCVIVRVDHPFAYRRSITWSELKNELILIKPSNVSYEFYNFIVEESKEKGFSPNLRTYLNEQSVILNLELGNGICVGTTFTLGKENKLVCSVPIKGYHGYIYAGVRTDGGSLERTFLNYMLEGYRE